jgi:nucleotide-binding universal stress UspA family protein
MSIQSIAAAVDFDEEIDDVLEIAGSLASATRAHLHVVHVYPPDPELFAGEPYSFPPSASPELHEAALQDDRARVRDLVIELHTRGIAATGYMKPMKKSIAASIIAFAHEMGADLLVIGTHRPGGLERIILGSSSEGVIHKSTIPILVVPRS